MQTPPAEIDWLSGLNVVQIGHSIPLVTASSLLGKLGATVRCVADVSSPTHQEQQGRSTSDPMVGPEGTKARLDANDALDAVAEANLVVCDYAHWDGAPTSRSDISDYLRRVEELNRSAWVTISAFGLTGRRAGHASSELIALAAGGLLAYTPHRRGGRRPVAPAGSQAQRVTADFGVLAGLYAYRRFVESGRPAHAEVSAQEAVISAGPFFECAHLLFSCPGESGSGRYAAPAGTFCCSDGYVYVSALEDHQWQGIVKALGYPEWAKDIRSAADRRRQATKIEAALNKWCSSRPMTDCTGLLQQEGVAATPMNYPLNLMRNPQSHARNFFKQSHGDRGAMTMALPVQLTTNERESAPGTTSIRTAPLRQLHVLDLSQVLGPPLAAAWLGSMGATVVKVEDVSRLETYRRMGPFADGVAGVDRSAYFCVSNHSKTSVVTDLATVTSDEVHRLIEWADVIIENWSLPRARRAGLTPQGIHSINPRAILISSSGFGRTGPLAEYRAYGHNLHAYAGLMALTKDSDGRFADVGTPWADPLTAVFLAILVVAASCSSESAGASLDVSMAEVVASHLVEYFERSDTVTGGQEEKLQDFGSGVYRCSGEDEWIVISVPSEQVRRRLCDVLNIDWRELVDKTSTEVRDTVELHLRTAAAHEWHSRLSRAGIGSFPVWSAHDLIDDPHLMDRGFFPEVDHPILGTRRMIGVPWRLVGERPLEIGPPPILGQSTVADVIDV